MLAAVAAMVVFAALDAFVFVLLIPFVQTVFNPGEASGVGGVLGGLLDATVWRWANPAEPLQAVQTVIVIIWIVLSWVVGFGRLGFDHPVRRFYDALSRGVEPILRPIRNLLPPLRIGGAALDLSPLVLFFGLIALEVVIC